MDSHLILLFHAHNFHPNASPPAAFKASAANTSLLPQPCRALPSTARRASRARRSTAANMRSSTSENHCDRWHQRGQFMNGSTKSSLIFRGYWILRNSWHFVLEDSDDEPRDYHYFVTFINISRAYRFLDVSLPVISPAVPNHLCGSIRPTTIPRIAFLILNILDLKHQFMLCQWCSWQWHTWPEWK